MRMDGKGRKGVKGMTGRKGVKGRTGRKGVKGRTGRNTRLDRWGGCEEKVEYRPRRLRLHGPDAFECVPAGAAVLRRPIRAGLEGGVRAQRGARQGVCGELGLP